MSNYELKLDYEELHGMSSRVMWTAPKDEHTLAGDSVSLGVANWKNAKWENRYTSADFNDLRLKVSTLSDMVNSAVSKLIDADNGEEAHKYLLELTLQHLLTHPEKLQKWIDRLKFEGYKSGYNKAKDELKAFLTKRIY